MRKAFRAALPATALLAGCVMAPPITAGSDLDAEVAAQVCATARTRTDLLGRLGVPAAIFARGRVERVSAVPSWGAQTPAAQFGEEQDPAGAFEMFADVRPANPDDRVYQWFHSRTTKTTVFAVLSFYETAETHVDRLWALVDPRTDAVRGVIWVEDP